MRSDRWDPADGPECPRGPGDGTHRTMRVAAVVFMLAFIVVFAGLVAMVAR